jgi:MoaA/NifB/PqqE/SkfB family radical SAM enzyme
LPAQATRSAERTFLPLLPTGMVRPVTELAAADFAISSIDLYLTSVCNRQCSYCFLSDSFFASRQHMQVSTVQEVIAWAAGSLVEEITLLGGEPALHPDFAEIVAIIGDAGLRVRIVTNGSYRFRKAISDHATQSAIARVAVSLDAPIPAIFDALRGRGAFRDADLTIQQLKRQGKPFDINCTVVNSSLPYVGQMLRFADDIGARRINIHWFSQVGRARTRAKDEAVSPGDWHAVLELVRGYIPMRSDFIVDCELGFAFGYRGENLKMCAVRDRTNLQFLPDGKVFSCGMVVDRPDLAGYLWREGRMHLRQAESEVTRSFAPCTGCPMRATATQTAHPDGHMAPIPLCIYNRLDRSPGC